jgi:hypothetical protein
MLSNPLSSNRSKHATIKGVSIVVMRLGNATAEGCDPFLITEIPAVTR